ncbi:hypothetical protein BJV78DRAFT_1195323, partial [Lactifluus subvellereus]
LDSFFFTNLGSEVVETVLKMARDIRHKQNIIMVQGAYHGRAFAGTVEPRHFCHRMQSF